MFAEIQSTLGAIRDKQTRDLGDVREHVSNLEGSLNAVLRQVEAGGFSNSSPTIIPVDAEYTNVFASFIRSGGSASEDRLRETNAIGERAAIQAAMSEGSSADGGYLAPVEWDRKVTQKLVASSPMRRLASVITSTTAGFTTLWNNNQWGSGWVGEVAARPVTTNAQLAQITFAAGEVYAQPVASQRLLDDAAINVEEWLANSLRTEFNRQENIAFLSGNGVNKPMGLLQYVTGGAADGLHPGSNLTVVDAALDVDALVDHGYSLPAPYRANASWLMASSTAAEIAKMKDANGNLIWRESLIVGQPATLLGRPVEIDEGMPAPTAGNLAIAFGDFRGYLINDRMNSLRILRDPYTNKPFVNFYATRRVGGGLLDNEAIRLLRIPA